MAARGGPPGAIATLYRGGHLTTISVGRADVDHPGAPRARDHMRIASVAKAFSGAVVLHLVQQRLIGLNDTIGQRLPSLPAAWGAVTVRQMLNHTSGLPDYTKSAGFKQVENDPTGFVAPSTIISWVRSKRVRFTPGSKYEYSNTDNIVLGLIAQAVTGESYGDPARRRSCSAPRSCARRRSRPRLALPTPFIHGYVRRAGARSRPT